MYIYIYITYIYIICIYLSHTHIYIIFNVSESNFKVIGSSRPHVRISKYPHVLLKGVNSLPGLPPGWPLPRLEQPQMVQPPGAGGQGRDAGIPPIHYYITSIRDPRWNPLSQTLYTPLDLNLNPIHHLGPILEIMQCSGSTLHSMTFCRFQKNHLAWCSRKIEGGCGFCRNIHGWFPCKREHTHCVSSQTVMFTFHRAGSPQQRSWDSMI